MIANITHIVDLNCPNINRCVRLNVSRERWCIPACSQLPWLFWMFRN